MKFGSTRSQLYDAQQTARAHWQAALDDWHDPAQRDFEERIWVPLDEQVASVIRSVDQLATIFTQIRAECEFPT